MIPRVMFGNGQPLNGKRSLKVVKIKWLPLVIKQSGVLFAVALGTTQPPGCVLPRATGSPRIAETMLSDFVSIAPPGQISSFAFIVKAKIFRFNIILMSTANV